MAIVWRPVTGNFADTLYNTLLSLEAPTTALRWFLQQNVKTPTIGIGFDLKAGAEEKKEVLRAMGFDVNGAWVDKTVVAGTPQAKEQQYIKDVLALVASSSKVQSSYDAIMATRKTDIESNVAYGQYIPTNRRSTFTFSNDTEVRAVFDALWPNYLKKITSLLNNPVIAGDATFLSSKELIALACAAYVGTWGPKAAKALSAGNRALAWFEFRYGWKESTELVDNPNNGWAKRHYFESAMLGLYDDPSNATATLDEAKNTYEMLTKNRALILQREAKYGAPPDGTGNPNNRIPAAKLDYQAVLTAAGSNDPQPLVAALTPAYTAFVTYANTLHGAGAPDINKAVISNAASIYFQGNPVTQTLDARVDDALTGKNLNNNLIVGGTGSDAEFGGKGADYLIGLGGVDNLDGGEGDDTLVGGAGNDILNGGAGTDIYAFDGGDGKDTIIDDSDGLGEVKVVGQKLDGGTPSQYELAGGVAKWTDTRGTVYTFVDSGSNKVDLTISGGNLGDGQIVIKDFDLTKSAAGGYLGIKLERPPKVAIIQGVGSNVFATKDFDPSSLAGQSTIKEGTGKTFTLFLNQAAKAGDTFTLALSNLSDKFKAILGDSVVDASGAIITLTEGQTQVSFALVQSGDVTEDGSTSLTVSYSGNNSQAATSNAWGVDLKDAGAITRTFNGDQHAVLTTGNPSVYNWGTTTWATDGTLVGGVVEKDFADVIYGTAGKDKINGLGGNDALSGGSGNDEIDGGAGDDLIGGGSGSDHILGGDGNDYINSSADLLVFQRVKPTDSWSPPGSQEVVTQGPGWGIYKDTQNGQAVTVWSGSNIPTGTDGDFVDAGAGNDWVISSGGDDRVQAGAGDDEIDGMAGNDVLEGGDGKDKIRGDGIIKPNFMNSVVAADNGADFLDGGMGDDTLYGGGQDDVVFGGGDNDTIFGDTSGKTNETDYLTLAYHGNDYLDGEDGNDYMEGGGKNDTLYGGAGDDNMWGDTSVSNVVRTQDNAPMWGNDLLDGEEGNDSLVGGGKDDTLYGGTGNDLMFGDESSTALAGEFHGKDLVDGEGGDDQLVGGGKDDVLYGGEGADTLFGDDQLTTLDGEFHGNDYLDGEEGDDYLEGGAHDDTLYGGSGKDVLWGDVSQGQLPAGQAGADYLDGEEGDDLLNGGGGNDTLRGGAGNDGIQGDGNGVAAGAQGDDLLDGGEGDDTLHGDAGNDTLIGGSGADGLDGGDGDDYLDGGDGDDNLFGGDGSDYLTGSVGDDYLDGEVGDDVLTGGEGGDILRGGDGNDYLEGGEGGDSLLGGDGNDTLVGGGGADYLDGGTGDDTYVLDESDTAVNGLGQAEAIGDSAGNNVIVLGGASLDSTQLLTDTSGTMQLVFDAQHSVIVINGAAGGINYQFGDGRTATSSELVGQLSDTATSGTSAAGVLSRLGGRNADQLVSNIGATTISGGRGADTLTGAGGNNTYLYSLGDGADSLTDTSAKVDAHGVAMSNRLVFGAGISAADLRLSGAAGALAVSVGSSGSDSITLGSFDQGNASALSPIDNFVFADGTALTYAQLIARGFDGGGGDDVVSATAGNDRIDGHAGNDNLLGQAGNDTLTGGAGNDSLRGGTGSDVYLFAAGDGQDVINNSDAGSGQVDTLRLLGLNSTDATLSTNGLDLIVKLRNSSDQVLVLNHFASGSALNRIEFANGVVWAEADFIANLTFSLTEGADNVVGTAGNDVFAALGGNDTVLGLAGNDVLDGGLGNDALNGGDGADTLYGGDGNDSLTGANDDDWLEGGAGNDTLTGGLGNDRYVFGRGDGQDMLNNLDATVGRVDTLQFRANVSPADVLVSRSASGSGTDLLLSIAGTTDSVQLVGYMFGDGVNDYTVNQIKFADGTNWSLADIKLKLLQGTTGNDSLYGYASSGDLINAGAGDDYGFGLAGADTINGGDGNDSLSGDDGDDRIDGGVGIDVLQGGNGNDTLIDGETMSGGAGNDTYLLNTWGPTTVRITETLSGTDALVLPVGVLPSSVRINQWFNSSTLGYDDLALQAYGPTGSGTVVLSQYFYSSTSDYKVEEIRFADGTIWNVADVLARNLDALRTEGNDRIIGYRWDETISALGGNDTVDGGLGNDSIDGGAGADLLRGGLGADTLEGGLGNDAMDGGADNDTFKIGRTTGRDTITDASGIDRILFNSDLLPADVTLSRDGNDLIVLVAGNAAQTRVIGHFAGTGQIESIEFSNGGTVWDAAAILARTVTGSANAMTGTAGNDTFVVDSGGDTITEGANQGVDTVQSQVSWTLGSNLENLTLTGSVDLRGTGNTLNNFITGNAGNNILGGGSRLSSSNEPGADTLAGGLGDDVYFLDGGENGVYGTDPAQADTVLENANEGYDSIVLVRGAYHYVMPDNVEALFVSDADSGWQNGFGEYLYRSLTGNAVNNLIEFDPSVSLGVVLDGGQGADTLRGGGGADFYVVDNVGDVVEERGALTTGPGWRDTVQASVSYTLGSGVEFLTLTGSAAIAGTGNALDNLLDGSTNTSANVLTGGSGNDIYRVGLGDTVIETAGQGNDTVEFNYRSADTMLRAGDFSGQSIETFRVAESAGGGLTLLGTALADNLVYAGYTGDPYRTFAPGGVLLGGLGNDTLTGGLGQDTLEGGAGDDSLAGGAGNDIYVFNRGDGHDSISGTGAYGTFDTLRFGPGIAKSDVSMTRVGLDLVVSINGSADTVAVRSYYANPDPMSADKAIWSIAFADGQTWDRGQINQWVANSGANTAPVNTSPMQGQTLNEGQAFGFSVPAGSFTDADVGDQLTYSATLAGGGALPAWLSFNATTGAFSGTAPIAALGTTSVKLTATDFLGLSASSTFNVTVQAQNQTLMGSAASETLAGLSGNDTLIGLAGDDFLIGNAGNDTFDGGAGNEGLDGGLGNDIYLFGRGDGQDQILEAPDTTVGAVNVLRFKAGVLASELTLKQVGANLQIWINGTTDMIQANSFFYGASPNGGDPGNSHNPLQRIEFADGTVWSLASIQALAASGNPNKAPIVAQPLADQSVAEGAALNFGFGTSAFTDPNLDTLTYSATLADGSPLPGWLAFNPTTRNFSGTASVPGTISVKVIASDGGLAVSDIFDIVVAQASAMNLTGTAGADSLVGKSNNDTLSGLAGNDGLVGNAGDDLLDGGIGNDAMWGGAGNDVYIVDSTSDSVFENADEGVDRVESSVSRVLFGNIENLTLTGTTAIDGTGNSMANVLIGNSAANGLNGAAGADTMIGGGGNDTYVVDDAGDVVSELAGGGSDEVQASVSVVLSNEVERLFLTGTADIDGTGNESNNQINGNSGANRIDGGAGADSMYGGAGYDTYVIDNAGDVIVEAWSSGLNAVEASVTWALDYYVFDRLTLTGSANINGTGNEWANTLVGNAGDNVLNGGTGWDTMSGGLGNDTYIVDEWGDAVVELAGGGVDSVFSGVDYVLADNVENLTLTGAVAGYLGGNSLSNTLTGNANANTLDGGAGADTMVGGAGDDGYFVESNDDVVVEGLTSGTDTVWSSVSYALGANVENLTLLGSGSLSATGNSLNNVVYGSDGDNRIDGGAGADTMMGGLGDDTYVVDNAGDVIDDSIGVTRVEASISYTLSNWIVNLTLEGSADLNGTGNQWDNNLIGNAGANVLDGGTGADTLAGGDGNDTYLVDNVADVIFENVAAGSDTVQSSISYTLGASVENLFLTNDYVDTDGTGNGADNIISGTQVRNVLDGGAGADTLIGGSGDDTYVVDNAGDVVVEDDVYGVDTVRSRISHTLSANIENLVLTGSAAIDGTGNDWANTLTGNGADNRIDGGIGWDTMSGGLGNDTYVVDDSNDAVIEAVGEGTDLVLSSASFFQLGANVENLTMVGAGAGYLLGNAGDNVLTGNAADNTLEGAGGADTLIGGAGNDTYIVSSSTTLVTENAAEGNDTVQASVSYVLGANVEALTLTGAASQSGTGNALANTLTGNGGDNTLDGGAGADTMAGGAGNDTYVVDNTADVINESASGGTDLVQSSASFTLAANVENLTLTGAAAINATGNTANNALIGNSVANTLNGGAGNDTMTGGLGDDVYVVDSATDVIVENASEGTDTVQTSVSLTLAANLENLTLIGTGAINATGNAAANVLVGNSGGNTLDAGAGADTMQGGAGNDIYVVDSTGDVIIENANEGTDNVQSSVNFTLGANVENVILTGAANLNGTGNSGANALTGNSGNNTLDGGTGADTMVGGAGNDLYIVDNTADVVTEAASAGTDLVQSSVTLTLAANVENLTLTGSAAINATGNTLANVLTGNAGVNRIDGGTGADTMAGGAGNDTYVVDNAGDLITELAGGGTDAVEASLTWTLAAEIETLTLTGTSGINGTGNASANTLIGNSGANRLDGGAGADTLTGGAGNDTYVVDNAGDSAVEVASGGTDTIESSINWTLGTEIENLLLTGAANINGTGNTLANTLTGNGGNNTLDGGTGADTMVGGLGDDIYVVDNAADVVTEAASAGTELVQSSITLTLGANVENLTLTTTAAVNGTGNTLANVITGNAGINRIDGGTGADTMVGAAGDDTYVVDNVGDVVTELAPGGVDLVEASLNWTLAAEIEKLTLTGISGINATGNTLANTLLGNAGANRLDGGAGADTMTGAAGNDTYVVDNVADSIVEVASGGTDTVESSINWTLGTELENLLLTGSGNINGTGNTLANTLTGNAGNNVLDGGAGIDTMVGGAGDDTYVIDVAGDVVTEAVSAGTDTVQTNLTYTLGTNVENLTLTGTTAINGTGNTLDNALVGNSGVNTLTGGAGNDSLNGMAGADTMVGGAGNDAYFVDNVLDVTTEGASEGTDTVNSSVVWTLGTNLENLMLTGSSAINGTGNASANVLIGNSGNNTLTAAAGNDTLDGAAGADTLIGGTGNDTYMMGRGYGAELLQENDATAGNTDVMQFLSGVASDQIWFRQVSNDLEVSIIGTTDKVLVQNWYLGSQYHVEQFKTSDGKTLLDSKVQDLVSAMASFTPPAIGQTSLPSNYQTTLMPIIAADWGP
jgi:trimeric autotransporter adhesin